MPKTKRRSRKQKEQTLSLHETKENIAPKKVSSDCPMLRTASAASKNALPNALRKIRHLKTQRKGLHGKLTALTEKGAISEQRHKVVLGEMQIASMEMAQSNEKLNSMVLKKQSTIEHLQLQNGDLKKDVARLSKKVARSGARQDRAIKKARATPIIFKLMHRKTYSVTARKMARMLVNAGCAQSQVGGIISQVGNLFGVKFSHPTRTMDARTVSRVVLEGLIAAKCQVGYEISKTQGILHQNSIAQN
jgi:hypothetical protein